MSCASLYFDWQIHCTAIVTKTVSCARFHNTPSAHGQSPPNLLSSGVYGGFIENMLFIRIPISLRGFCKDIAFPRETPHAMKKKDVLTGVHSTPYRTVMYCCYITNASTSFFVWRKYVERQLALLAPLIRTAYSYPAVVGCADPVWAADRL